MRASRHYKTLVHLRGRRKVEALPGGRGQGKKQKGKKGNDVVVEVPVGTVVWHLGGEGEKELLADLADDGTEVVAVCGGVGGRGNAEFVSPVKQEPLLAEAGERGEERCILLELKLLADVGIIGQPCAGKSTFLAAVSRARPMIAPYAFTTVEPVLGVVETGRQQVLMVEIPGLVEGAHEGRGLGLEFLRHAERTRVLLHLVDGAADDPVAAYRQVNYELAFYSAALAARPQVVALTKVDLPHVLEKVPVVQSALMDEGVFMYPISAATGEGMAAVLGKVVEGLASQPPAPPGAVAPQVLPEGRTPSPSPSAQVPQVWRDGHVIVVSFPRAERLVKRADLRRWQVRVQLHQELARMGVIRALKRFGVKPGDTVRIGSVEMEWT